MSKLQVKELRAYVKGQEKQIEDQRKAMDTMHETILEDIKKIEHLEATRKHHISVVAYLEFKLEQKNGHFCTNCRTHQPLATAL